MADNENFEMGKNSFKKTFEVFDKDGDGFITPDEFWKVLSSFDVKLSREEADELIQKYDRSRDELINFEEFALMMSNLEELIELNITRLKGPDLENFLKQAENRVYSWSTRAEQKSWEDFAAHILGIIIFYPFLFYGILIFLGLFVNETVILWVSGISLIILFIMMIVGVFQKYVKPIEDFEEFKYMIPQFSLAIVGVLLLIIGTSNFKIYFNGNIDSVLQAFLYYLYHVVDIITFGILDSLGFRISEIEANSRIGRYLAAGVRFFISYGLFEEILNAFQTNINEIKFNGTIKEAWNRSEAMIELDGIYLKINGFFVDNQDIIIMDAKEFNQLYKKISDTE